MNSKYSSLLLPLAMAIPLALLLFRFRRPVYSKGFITINTEEGAKKLARSLVEQEVVACVNIVPQVTSIYRWENKVEEESEYLLIFKTRTSLVSRCIEIVKKEHPYDVPEVIVSGIDAGNEEYLSWIGKSTKDD